MTNAPDRIWIAAFGGNWSAVKGGTQDVEYVRADRAEAALAAQIEVDAGIADSLATEWWGNYKTITHEHSYSQHREGMSDGADEIATAIRAQPHDRTALDRMLAEAEARGIKRAADRTLGLATGHECRTAILAMIEKPDAT